MSQLSLTPGVIVRTRDGDLHVAEQAREQVRSAVLAFLDSVATATGRETFYNTRAEQLAAEEAIHQAVFALDRGLYGVLLTLPGSNDHSLQLGVRRLLDEPRRAPALLDEAQEARLLRLLVDRLPPQRLIKLFVMLQQGRINNRRTRRLVLQSVLGSSKLPLWSVKYRLKLRAALRHALGTGIARGVRELTNMAERDDRAAEVKLQRLLGRYLPEGADRDTVYQCINFILGGTREYTVPLLAAFHAARTDLEKGATLPVEVLGGIRSRYHKDVPHARVLELDLEKGATLPVEVLGGIRSRYHKDVPHARVLELAKRAGTMTEGQKMALQRSAAQHDVELIFDARKADMVRLYVYALECGMTGEVRAALDEKAGQLARGLPLRYQRIGIVVDGSASMLGTAQGKYRPLSISLAVRDILAASAKEVHARASRGAFDKQGLLRPEGETDLAASVVELAARGVEAIYLLTDGYENAPAGRVDEVLRQLRGLGLDMPVYQLAPVLAGERMGVRSLSPLLSAMPISRPEGLALALVRAALEQDIDRGIQGLLSLATPLLLLEEKAR
jgi:hypothetical protein